MRTTKIALLLLVAGSSAASAEYRTSSAADHETQQQWRTIDADMSPYEYRVASRRNKRLLIDIMTFHSKRALASTGISEDTMGLVGAAALLPVRDTRFHLNRSRTLAVEFQDVMEGDRTLLLEFKRKW